MSDTAVVVLVVLCFAIAVGGFATGLRLVRRVRTESEATNADATGNGDELVFVASRRVHRALPTAPECRPGRITACTSPASSGS